MAKAKYFKLFNLVLRGTAALKQLLLKVENVCHFNIYFRILVPHSI